MVQVGVEAEELARRLANISKELYLLVYQFQKIQSHSLNHQNLKPNSSEILYSDERSVCDGKDKNKKAA